MKCCYIDDFSIYADFFSELSDMQLKVFVMYGQGFKPDNICFHLGISKNTFNSHLKTIKDKYEVSHNFELKNIFNARKDYFHLKLVKKLLS